MDTVTATMPETIRTMAMRGGEWFGLTRRSVKASWEGMDGPATRRQSKRLGAHIGHR